MPRKDDFDERDYDLDEIREAMADDHPLSTEDELSVQLSNARYEVHLERIEPDSERVRVIAVEALSDEDLNRFVDYLEAE